MPVDHSEFAIVKTLDKTTPLMADKDWIIIESYSTGGSHILPDPRPDGTSNTFMYAEKYQLDDKAYVLTGIQHGSVDTLQTSFLGGIIVASGEVNGDTDTFGFGGYDGGTAAEQPDVRTGTWIMDTTYQTGSHLLYQDVVVPPPLETGPAVAMETLTIANEGFWLV